MCCSCEAEGAGSPVNVLAEMIAPEDEYTPVPPPIRSLLPRFQAVCHAVGQDEALDDGFRIFLPKSSPRMLTPAWKPVLPVSKRPPAVKLACATFVQQPTADSWDEEASELPELPDATCRTACDTAFVASGRADSQGDLDTDCDTEVETTADSCGWEPELDTPMGFEAGAGSKAPREDTECCWVEESDEALDSEVPFEHSHPKATAAMPAALRPQPSPLRRVSIDPLKLGDRPLPPTRKPRASGPTRMLQARQNCRPLPGPPASPRAPVSASLGMHNSPGFLWSELDIHVEESDPSNVIAVECDRTPFPAVSSSSSPSRAANSCSHGQVECENSVPRINDSITLTASRAGTRQPNRRACNLAGELTTSVLTAPGASSTCCIGGEQAKTMALLLPAVENSRGSDPLVVTPALLACSSRNVSNVAEQLLSLSKAQAGESRGPGSDQQLNHSHAAITPHLN